ncbi:MAG: hypothetical protein EHM79_16770 [Geobacter sp.]|nr:MAG: hypothetical protein EHM79_16770 [Geobacter sp.]
MKAIWKNAVEEIRIDREMFHGHDLVGVRIFIQHQSGEWRPSRKGLTLRPDTWREVIEEVVEILKTEPLS